MKTEVYPKIGSKVSFVRQGEGGDVIEGSGTIYAICVDPDKRLMAHLLDDMKRKVDDGMGAVQEIENRFNVHLSCLNPTPEFVGEFKAINSTINNIGEEGNRKTRAIVEEYNKMVADLQEGILGPVVLFEGGEPKNDTEASQEHNEETGLQEMAGEPAKTEEVKAA